MEASSINSDHDPRVGQEMVRLLKVLYVFISCGLLVGSPIRWMGILYLEFAIFDLCGGRC